MISSNLPKIDKTLLDSAINLLRSLIATPSYSREEAKTAGLIEEFLKKRGIPTQRQGNNVWCQNHHWQEGKMTILLNSHHDTVKPAAGWQRDPFTPALESDRLFGLGSNDAGGALVGLIAAFLHFYEREDLPFNLVLAATAEEEISGAGGVASIMEALPKIDCGIIGEPTSLQMAVAEKGLVVVDGLAKGQSGHAAREEGANALYIALEDIDILRRFQFEKVSELLGPVKVSVTQIEAGTQHNVVPDRCRFVVDVRTNEHYSNREVVEILQSQIHSELKARSYRLNSSGIAPDHPLVKAGKALGLKPYGSPTLSDQALLPFPTIKLGPGDSARSHTADEYIRVSEIEAGLRVYVGVLQAWRKGVGE